MEENVTTVDENLRGNGPIYRAQCDSWKKNNNNN
jgi:hypothetical protein